ncbi:MAG: ribosome small subunit-dependent GTPase A [Cytophagales bacterium]|nr:ribosome small subunit-dependent GTPase A [Cytophagales bacterium]
MQKQGVIIRSTGSWYNIRQKDGTIVQGRLRGKFKLKGLKVTNPIAVGDLVEYKEDEKGEENTVVITKILPRTNYVVRKSTRKAHHAHMLASNIDQAILIATFKSPQTSLGFIDRFLISTESFRIPTLIIFNKIDLLTEEEKEYLEELCVLYKSLGYDCLFTSAKTGEGLEELKEVLSNKTSFLSGHSGAGKSSLINTTINNVNIKTSEISDYSDKGKHTTTFSEMHQVDKNTYIIDSPGIKELGLVSMKVEEISHYFPEMRDLLNECKYHNCTHTHEPQCAVFQATNEGEIAPSRYLSYLSILDDDDFKKNPKAR